MPSGNEGTPQLVAIIGKHGMLNEPERAVEFGPMILDELIECGMKQLLWALAANSGEHLSSLDVFRV